MGLRIIYRDGLENFYSEKKPWGRGWRILRACFGNLLPNLFVCVECWVPGGNKLFNTRDKFSKAIMQSYAK